MNDHRLPCATSFRPLHLKAMMAGLEAAWKCGTLPPPSLDADQLFDMARAQTGLHDDPDRAFFESQLSVLLKGLRHEARLNRFGELVAEGSLLKIMKERLRFAALMQAHPEIDAMELAPPIIVVGSMRSGTTRLQRLLACDSAFTALRLYEATFPVPAPNAFRARDRRRRDPRIRATGMGLALLKSINPAIQAVHPTGPLEVDEELGLNEQSLSGALIEAQRRVPGFARHCERVDQMPVYLHLQRLLKLRSWFADVDPARPYVLKTPQHMQDLAAVNALFPQSRMIFLHRHPVTVVASGASLAWNQMVMQSDHVEPAWIGQEWLHKTEHRLRVTSRVRETMAASRQIDIGFEDVSRDWLGAVRRIYAFLDRELRPETISAMQDYMQRSARDHGYHRHRYRLESFGIRPGEVMERLGRYAEKAG